MVRDGVLLLVLERSSDKALEQGMCAVGAALEFGVKLYAHMEITAGQLNSFHQAAIRAGTGDHKAVVLHLCTVVVVELIAVAVAFVNFFFAIALTQLGALGGNSGVLA